MKYEKVKNLLARKYMLEKMLHTAVGVEKKVLAEAIESCDKTIFQELEENNITWDEVANLSSGIEV